MAELAQIDTRKPILVTGVQGLFPGISYPRVPGHEAVGRIESLGEGVLGRLASELKARASRASASKVPPQPAPRRFAPTSTASFGSMPPVSPRHSRPMRIPWKQTSWQPCKSH
jgi:NADPH:quinone reductase-like Zn-dependent oxidoreductase